MIFSPRVGGLSNSSKLTLACCAHIFCCWSVAVVSTIFGVTTGGSGFAFEQPIAATESWGVNDHTHEAMLIRLRELEGVKAGSNQVADVLIAETAMRRNAVLVSGDKKLRILASEFGIEVLSLEEFARRTPATSKRSSQTPSKNSAPTF